MGETVLWEASGLSSFWKFLASVRELPVHGSLERLALLCAFCGAPLIARSAKGVSIAWLSDRAGIPTEIARHQIRMLRAEGAVVVTGRIGRTELFSLSDSTKAALDKCLAVFGSAHEASLNPSKIVTLDVDEASAGRRTVR